MTLLHRTRPGRPFARPIALVAVLALAACSPGGPRTAPGADLLVLTSDFTSGSFTTQDLDGAWRIDLGAGLVGPDAAARSFAEPRDTVWIMDRGETDRLLRIDVRSGTPRSVGAWETGPGTNPHDLWVVEETAFLTLYDQPNLLALDLEDGTRTEIALSDHPALAACAAPDGLTEMDQIFKVGGKLLVTLQCLDRSDPWNWVPATTGKVVVLDYRTRSVEAVVDLPGCLNPHDAAETTGGLGLVISCTGAYDGGGDGAIVHLSYADMSVTTLVSEGAFGGDVLGLAAGESGEVFVIVTDSLGSWDTWVSRWTPAGGVEVVHAPADGFWHNRLAVKRGMLWMAGGSPWTATAGIVRLDTGTLAVVDQTPLATGLPPQVLVWVGDPYFGGGGH
ncbi:hypothetical protein IIA16_03055 [bacterium]|nr:hypothetical protein [bacterium]